MQRREHVLQLITEAKGAARLVEPGARPEPGAQRLIEQPAVFEHVEGGVRCLDLNRAEELFPAVLQLRKTLLRLRWRRVLGDERSGVVDGIAVSKHERHDGALPRRDL